MSGAIERAVAAERNRAAEQRRVERVNRDARWSELLGTHQTHGLRVWFPKSGPLVRVECNCGELLEFTDMEMALGRQMNW